MRLLVGARGFAGAGTACFSRGSARGCVYLLDFSCGEEFVAASVLCVRRPQSRRPVRATSN